MNYASFWQRLIGWIVDLLITFPILWTIHKSSLGQNLILSQMLGMLFEGCYYVYFWLVKGATPGMMLMKIRLYTDNDSLTFLRAIIRYIGLNLSFYCLGLGLLWMLWDRKRQTWQDKMAKTYVIRIGEAAKEKAG